MHVVGVAIIGVWCDSERVVAESDAKEWMHADSADGITPDGEACSDRMISSGANCAEACTEWRKEKHCRDECAGANNGN